MNLNKETKDDTMIVSVLDPRIDASTAVDLKAQICEVIDEGQHELVLDLSRVDFIDSSGIGAIVGMRFVIVEHLPMRVDVPRRCTQLRAGGESFRCELRYCVILASRTFVQMSLHRLNSSRR